MLILHFLIFRVEVLISYYLGGGNENMVDGIRIDPWSSSQSTDYQRIIDQFGLTNLDSNNLPSHSILHRRNIVFDHRDLEMMCNIYMY